MLQTLLAISLVTERRLLKVNCNCLGPRFFTMEQCTVRVSLNGQDGTVCEVLLSAADAERCYNDMEFATRVLEVATADTPAQIIEDSESRTPCVASNLSSASSSCTQEALEDEGAGVFKWFHAAVLLLVETFKVHEGSLHSGKTSQKKVWEKVSRTMNENGHMVSGPQCMSKFNGMKRTFKAISDHNSKSGNNPRSWPYLELMQSLLGERPFMEPPALSSSTCDRERMRTTCEPTAPIERAIDDLAPSSSGSRSRKRTASSAGLAEAILESRRIAEENKNRRHREMMERKDKLLEKLDALLEKL